MSKRVVLLWCRGPKAGLHEITGTEDQILDAIKEETLPTFTPLEDALGSSASLIAVKPRFFLYRQNTPKEAGRFDDFHPSQV